MAKIYLRSDGGREIVDLPPVCMKCGEPATVRKSKQFSWVPPWVGAFAIIPALYMIVAIAATKRQRVEAPFCDRHASYWWMYPLVMWLSVLGMVGLGVILTVGVLATAGPGHEGVAALPWVAVGLGLLVVAIVGIVMNYSRIRTVEITDRFIHLKGVHEAFADAMEDMEDRQRSPFDREDFRERGPRRPRREEQDDDPRYTR